MKSIFLALFVLSFSSLATAGTVTTYKCFGKHVAGDVKIHLLKEPTELKPFPDYKSWSQLRIMGKSVTLNCWGPMSNFKREIPFGRGAWNYDKSIRTFALCGADLKLNGWGEGFQLYVGKWGVHGYLGHRDHRKGPQDNSKYNFSCRKESVETSGRGKAIL